MLLRRVLLILISASVFPITGSAQSLDTAKIDQVLGRPGQKMGDVYRVGFPRTDLHVVVDGVAIKLGLALGSWAAFAGTDSSASVMGDLVLLESELDPVMEKLRGSGFEITAVHNHLTGETPHVMYMHYMGHGPQPSSRPRCKRRWLFPRLHWGSLRPGRLSLHRRLIG